MRTLVVMSWSGGKDSVMALHDLLGASECEVVELMATVSEEYRRVSHHGVREELLDAQAAAVGIPLHISHPLKGADARMKFTKQS